MISGTYSFIRAAEPDDAVYLHACYDARHPRAALLDLKREPVSPTVDELRELLGRKDTSRGALYVIEDTTGVVCGLCGLRGMGHEANFSEATVLFLSDEAFGQPLAEEMLAFLVDRGFRRMHLNKLMTHCLDNETALRSFLVSHGFVSEGVQREAVYAGGRWHNIEILALLAREWAARVS